MNDLSEKIFYDTFKKSKENGSVHDRPKIERLSLENEKVDISNFFKNEPKAFVWLVEVLR